LLQSEFSQAKIRLIEHHRQQMLSEKQRCTLDSFSCDLNTVDEHIVIAVYSYFWYLVWLDSALSNLKVDRSGRGWCLICWSVVDGVDVTIVTDSAVIIMSFVGMLLFWQYETLPFLWRSLPSYTMSRKKETKMFFFVISSIKLGWFWWNSVCSFLNKIAVLMFSTSPAILHNVSTLPCETWNVSLSRACYHWLVSETPEFVPSQLASKFARCQSIWLRRVRNTVSAAVQNTYDELTQWLENGVGQVGSCWYCGRYSSVASSPISVR